MSYCDNIVKILKFKIAPKMATELQTNGTTAEYSPRKEQQQNGNGNGSEEKYTKKDQDRDEERVPLTTTVDVEKSVPVAKVDDDELDSMDSVSLSGMKEKKNKKKIKDDTEKRPLKGEWVKDSKEFD